MKKLLYGLDSLFAMIPLSLITLLGRLSIGLVFWNSGRTKVQGWNIFDVSQSTLYLFQNDYKVPLLPPEVAALMTQVAENTLPLLLFVGLATRYAALGMLGMTLVIEIFVYPGAYVVHGTWATILLLLIKFGPGVFSVDHLINRR